MMNKVMLECIRIARQNMDDDQYPIGAIITDDRGKIISSSRSSLRKELDPTNHPEIAAIRKASKILKRRKLKKCYLFTTLEPCPMCTSATIWACMEGIVYGASQEEAIKFVEEYPEHKLSWRQIPITADYIISKSGAKIKLFGGIQKKLCQGLFK